MIKNQWYVVLSSAEVKERPVGVTRLSRKMVLWRDTENTVCCIADQCCHRGASLAAGKVCAGELACPFHGFQYDASGKVTCIPANGRKNRVPDNFQVKAYTVREAYGFIWIWNGDEIKEELPEIPFFNELAQGFSYGEFHENWMVHYSRAIENQLDVVHLPFVHRTTIGRGNKVLVNGPVVRWDGTKMTFYVKNEEDKGQIPESAEEMQHYESLFHLQMQMPNLWQNCISDRLRIMAAFAPVDEENTVIYLRFYHRFLTKGPGNWLINHLGNLTNRVILHQDRRVVLTQLPLKSELNSGENLIPGDMPIIAYRSMREQLKKNSH